MGILNCIKNIFKSDNQPYQCCIHKWDLDRYKHMRECSKCGLRQYLSYKNGKGQWVNAMVVSNKGINNGYNR